MFIEKKTTSTTTHFHSNHLFPAIVHGFQHYHAILLHKKHSIYQSPPKPTIKSQKRKNYESFYKYTPFLSTISSPSLSSITILASKNTENDDNNYDKIIKSWSINNKLGYDNQSKKNNEIDNRKNYVRGKMDVTYFIKKIQSFGPVMMMTMIIWCVCVPSMNLSWAIEEYNSNRNKPYYTIMSEGSLKERQEANYALLDYAVGTINTQFYDPTAGANFAPQDLYQRFQQMRSYTKSPTTPKNKKNLQSSNKDEMKMPQQALDDRDNVIDGLKWLVSTLQDPYSKYLTRQELLQEYAPTTFNSNNEYNSYDDFLESRFGVIIGKPRTKTSTATTMTTIKNQYKKNKLEVISTKLNQSRNTNSNGNYNDGYYHYNHLMLSPKRNTIIESLPIVTAVIPDSVAERNGIITGDRIVAIGNDSFLDAHHKSSDTAKRLTCLIRENDRELTIAVARPVLLPPTQPEHSSSSTTTAAYIITTTNSSPSETSPISSTTKDVLLGYRLSHVHIHNQDIKNGGSMKDHVKNDFSSSSSIVAGGNAVVHYQLLTPKDSLFVSSDENTKKVGYIRLTRFSRTATAGYIDAVQKLEQAGAQSYIIDVRNNYGGIIQEAFLTASTLLRDPHMVLSYTMNSRGGFAPNDVQQYIIDSRYPGHLLSKTTMPTDLQKDLMFAATTRHEWAPPSSYASLHEQSIKYGIHRPTSTSSSTFFPSSSSGREKDLVVLINEGTASSAEVFASALHDNGRLVALVGAKTYGKGLIQHTFPMPDGGGLRLTIGEYLTPSLHHVTKVGGARYNDQGDLVGGGIQPDILCPSNHGISSNVGADLCVGMALDALQQHESSTKYPSTNNI